MTTIQDYLAERSIDVVELPHQPTHTARGEAAHLGVAPDGVAKTIVLDANDGHALAVIPASERLDMRLVRRAVGDAHAQLASEEELQRDYPEYELGAYPPLGSLLHAPVYVDPSLMEHDTVVFAAGRADTSLRVKTEELFRDEAPVVTPLVRDVNDKEQELLG